MDNVPRAIDAGGNINEKVTLESFSQIKIEGGIAFAHAIVQCQVRPGMLVEFDP